MATVRQTVAVALALLLALLASGCLTDTDAPSPTSPTADSTSPGLPRTFHLNATGCRELLGIFRIPIETARDFVPAGHTPLGEETGFGTAFAGLKHCEATTINGEPIGYTSTSDVGVFVDKGEPGVFHYYQVWWYTNNSRLHEHLKAGGWVTGLSADSLTPAPNPPSGTRAQVDGPAANYTIAGTSVGGGPGGTNVAVGWHDTPSGTLRISKDLIGTSMGGGHVTLTGDGDITRLIEYGSLGAALWNAYDMVGQVH